MQKKKDDEKWNIIQSSPIDVYQGRPNTSETTTVAEYAPLYTPYYGSHSKVSNEDETVTP